MQIEHIIFDLDNTLYPASGAMDEGITKRMQDCIMKHFNCNREEAIQIRKENIRNHSTTLEWLRSSGFTDVEGFFAHVHPENEADEVDFNPELRSFLMGIKIPKIILTNAPKEHAERVLKKLNVQDLFETICDIRSCDFLGKPYYTAYQKALDLCGGTIENTIFIDDLQKYTDGYAAIGGTAILLGNKTGNPLNPESPAVFKGTPPHPGKTIKIASLEELPMVINLLQS